MPEATILTEEEIMEETTIEPASTEHASAEKETEASTSAQTETSEPFADGKTDTFTGGPREHIDCFEKEKPRKFFHFHRENEDFSRDKWILSRIRDEDLMEYLKLEQKRNEQLQLIKEKRSKRLMTAFQLTISLVALVTVIYLLKDTPTILVNILYICGIIAALWLWKNPRDTDKK